MLIDVAVYFSLFACVFVFLGFFLLVLVLFFAPPPLSLFLKSLSWIKCTKENYQKYQEDYQGRVVFRSFSYVD